MTQTIKASCSINLGYPYHGAVPLNDLLIQMHDYVSQQSHQPEELGTEQGAAVLEQKVAKLLGKKAALWLPTGTLAQGIAARIHGQRIENGQLLLHPSSHLLLHEEEGYYHAHGSSAKIIGRWREPLQPEDFDDAVGCAFIELPQRHSGGKLPSWDALVAIKSRCKSQGIPLHMDGARLWSCRPFYNNKTYAQIASGFDSVYLSLYKDIGAIGGAILAGDKSFIDEARIWRTRLGGFSVGSWPLIYDALRLLDTRIAQMPEFVRKAGELASSIGHIARLQADPQLPHTNLFHILLPVSAQQAQKARDQLAQQHGIWLADRFWGYESDQQCAMEIVVGEKALALDKQVFAEAMAKFAHAIGK
ncbi:threonine aldolase family protein [Aliiglaciecola litoralis]|uniref:Aminotransferase class I/II-fold pyridoxal phosphate-dependent enzyme n=1 Tax=Aliiglaciecola litoralis TaxID=582857 RepID=A0ABN1LEL0_9ALTE